MRFRMVKSSVPGGQSFFGLVRSQNHFGHSTGGGFGVATLRCELEGFLGFGELASDSAQSSCSKEASVDLTSAGSFNVALARCKILSLT